MFVLFALVAIAANLGTQALVLLSSSSSIHLALATGTAAGLVVKFLLDKHYLFHDRDWRASTAGRQFAAYTLIGLGTTGVFWATELTFHALFASLDMTALGGFVGLVIGYAVKYVADERITFSSGRNRKLSGSSTLSRQ